ncbi:hypothetical protein M2318_005299 [Metapseudomonas resinovorans]|uniref:phage regulatory CII family protein n=1 Tax=Metapseudomonas resinovorans TaxID=53412 RepID=UPI003D1F021E
MEEVHRALHDTVLEAGPKTLAHLMGMSHTSLLNRSNPNDDTHRLSFEQFLQILVHSNNVRTLRAIAGELGYDVVPRRVQPSGCLTQATLCMASEAADVTKAAIDAMGDGVITRMEVVRIEREGEEAKNKIDVVIATAKAKVGSH